MEIVKIINGFLIVQGAAPEAWLYCKDKAELHKELEFILGAEPMPEPPQPPTAPKADEGVRQFSDED